MNKRLRPLIRVPFRRFFVLCSAAVTLIAAHSLCNAQAISGNLVVSHSIYVGTATTVAVGQTLPGGGTATADGGYPEVWNNAKVDSSFGVTSPIYIDTYSVSGSTLTPVSTISIPASGLVNSFSSKSELALNLSTDGRYITFNGYESPVNTLDVSNSNTPNHVDPTNPVAESYQRAIAQFDTFNLNPLQVTAVNTYSGNNGRASIFDVVDNQYLTVGNAGNGSGTEPVDIVDNTGVQIAIPSGSPETTVVGVQQGTSGSKNGFQFGYSVTQNGDPADKSGKDNNFRGIAIYNNSLFVTKGSGSNGINTVYQVGTAGTLPTEATASTTAINILPGFSTTLANAASPAVVMNPFGIWFANANTLYVADEGNGSLNNPNAGLQKWVLETDGNWHNVYTLQNGLNRGIQYSIQGTYPAGFSNPAPDGLRSLTGIQNTDGTVTLFSATSTMMSSFGDEGADPNQLVSITDNPSFMTAAAANGEQFTNIATAGYAEVFRGVVFDPLTASFSTVISGLNYARRTQTFNGTIQLTNTSGNTIAGPIQVELQNLPAGVTLVNANGTDNGNPYLTTAAGGLTPGQSVTVPVSFSDPSMVGINYSVQYFSGTF